MSDILNRWEQWIVHRMTASHLAGPDISDAVWISRQAAEHGWAGTNPTGNYGLVDERFFRGKTQGADPYAMNSPFLPHCILVKNRIP